MFAWLADVWLWVSEAGVLVLAFVIAALSATFIAVMARLEYDRGHCDGFWDGHRSGYWIGKKAGKMDIDWEYERLKKFHEDAREYDAPIECPNCGSSNVHVCTSLEDTDADGNRGRIERFLRCYTCGNEWGHV